MKPWFARLGAPFQSSRQNLEPALAAAPRESFGALARQAVALHAPLRRERALSPQTLGQALRAADQGNLSDLMGLAVLLEDRDTQWRAVLQSRKGAVTGLALQVEAPSDAVRHQQDAELIREVLSRTGIRRLMFDLLDGLSKGFAVIEIEWATEGPRWLPRRFLYRDPRWFETKPDDPDRLLWLPAAAQALQLDPATALTPGRYIVHRPMLTSAPAPQAGLCRPGIWLWMFKSFGIRDWIEFLEAYGQPLRIGKYPPGASASEKTVLREAVIELGRAAGVMIPQGMELTLEGAGVQQTSPDFHLKLVNYFDQQTSKLVLGQTATTDAIAGGHAVSQEHDGVRRTLRDADAADLAETLERDLIRFVIDLNHGTPPGGLYPKLRIAPPGNPDSLVLASVLEKLVPLGLTVEQSVVRDRLGLPDPPLKIAPEALLRPPAPSWGG